VLEHPHDPRRGAGSKARLIEDQTPEVRWVESIGILARINRSNHRFTIKSVGEGVSNQDDIDFGVVVEIAD